MVKLRTLNVRLILLWSIFILPLMLGGCTLVRPRHLQALQSRLNSPSICGACRVMRVVYNEVGALSSQVYPKMCGIALSFMALILAFWLMIHFVRTLIVMRKPNVAEFWVPLFHTLFKCALMAAFIASGERVLYVIDHILMPIASLIASVGFDFLDMNWVSTLVSTERVYTSGIEAVPGFSAELGLQLENLIYRVNVAFNLGIVLGLRLLTSGPFWNFVLGGIVTVIFFLVSLVFPYYLIDGIIRMAFVFCMLPIAMMCWCFRFTAQYFKTAWNIFLGAFLQITLGCIFVSVSVAVIEGFLQLRIPGYLSPQIQDESAEVLTDAARMSVPFLAFVLVAFYIYKLSKQVNEITGYFTGVPASSVFKSGLTLLKGAGLFAVFAVVSIVGYFSGNKLVGDIAREHATEGLKDATKEASKES